MYNKYLQSIFETSPRSPGLKFKKTLRDFAFNRDGDDLRAQYKDEAYDQQKEYVDILKDSDIIDEEMNLIGQDSAPFN
jgi:hypothetical protein